jgi:type 1 fimbria pilin
MIIAIAIATLLAFTSKLVNPTGYVAGPDGTVISGETNNPNCQVQASGTLCYIILWESNIEPVYETASDALNGNSSKILRYQ